MIFALRVMSAAVIVLSFAVHAVAQRSAGDVVQPTITLSVRPENPRAGTRVTVLAETVGIDEESALNWRFPQVTNSDGESFEAAAIVAQGGRSCEIVWPEGGKYAIGVETLLIEAKTIPGRDGAPDKIVPTKWEVVRGRLTLSLRGGAGPTPDDPPLPAPDAGLQSLVVPVRDALRKADAQAEAIELRALFSSVADVIERDSTGKIINRTAHVRELNRRAGVLLAQPNKLGPIGLAALCEAALQAKIGLEDRELSAELRAVTVATFRALAWACEGSRNRE